MSQCSNPLTEATSTRTPSLTGPKPQAQVTPAQHITDFLHEKLRNLVDASAQPPCRMV